MIIQTNNPDLIQLCENENIECRVIEDHTMIIDLTDEEVTSIKEFVQSKTAKTLIKTYKILSGV